MYIGGCDHNMGTVENILPNLITCQSVTITRTVISPSIFYNVGYSALGLCSDIGWGEVHIGGTRRSLLSNPLGIAETDLCPLLLMLAQFLS